MPQTIIKGPAGRLEARVHCVSDGSPPLAVILHPHPLHGGTMNTKVVYTLFRCFVNMGFAVARFNFRGVGDSEGSFDHGNGEVDDAICVLRWLQAQYPRHGPVWLAGFSFGGRVLLRTLAAYPGIDGFVAVAPSLEKRSPQEGIPCNGLVIQGDADDVVNPQEVAEWSRDGTSNATVKMVAGAGHFFEREHVLLQELVDSWVRPRIQS